MILVSKYHHKLNIHTTKSHLFAFRRKEGTPEMKNQNGQMMMVSRLKSTSKDFADFSKLKLNCEFVILEYRVI